MKKFVKIELDKPRNIFIDMQAMINIEDELGRPLQGLEAEKLTTRVQLLILTEGLKHEDKALTKDDVLKIMGDAGINASVVMESIGKAMAIYYGNETDYDELLDEQKKILKKK